MILRRLSQSLKTQNWTAIWIEFILLVCGVFLGMQVSNWNEARVERKAEIAYLHSLQSDVQLSVENLEGIIKALEIQRKSRKALYAYSIDPKAVMSEVDRDFNIFQGLFLIPTHTLNQITFETLKSSGRLSILGSQELATALQELNTMIARVEVIQKDELQVTYLFSDPMLVADFNMRGAFQQAEVEDSIPWLSNDRHDSLSPELMKTVHFGNIILYRTYFSEIRLKKEREILKKYHYIAKLIEQRQVELGVIK
jgi:hypothetical protein